MVVKFLGLSKNGGGRIEGWCVGAMLLSGAWGCGSGNAKSYPRAMAKGSVCGGALVALPFSGALEAWQWKCSELIKSEA